MLTQQMFDELVMDFYITIQWLRLGMERHIWTNRTNGYKEPNAVRDLFAFGANTTDLGNEPTYMLVFSKILINFDIVDGSTSNQ